MPRLLRCYRGVNRSRADVGSVVPTNFRIDREVLARLLGFDGCLQNSLYGYSAFDIEVLLLGVLELFAADLSHYTAAPCRHGWASCIDVTHHAAVGMHETQRARSAASNLYLDTTPMIRGAITFSTHDCLLVVEHLRVVLRILNQEMHRRSPRYGKKPSRDRVDEMRYPWKSCLASYIRSVGREKTRLRQAEVKLRLQVSRVIRSVVQGSADGLH